MRRFFVVFSWAVTLSFVPMFFIVRHFEEGRVFDSIGTWYTVLVTLLFSAVLGLVAFVGYLVSLTKYKSVAVTTLFVAGLAGLFFFALYKTKRQISCQVQMQTGAGPMNMISFYHVDLEKSVMSSESGDQPIKVTKELISWRHMRPTRDGKSQIVDEGSINRIDGSLHVVRTEGPADRTVLTGTCSGAT